MPFYASLLLCEIDKQCSKGTSNMWDIKDSFTFHKRIPTNTKMTTLYTNWSLCITFTMINYIRQE